jgi:hypothetical protein
MQQAITDAASDQAKCHAEIDGKLESIANSPAMASNPRRDYGTCIPGKSAERRGDG